MKTCTKCNLSKEDNEFHKKGDKLQCYCKSCKAIVDNNWYMNNHEQRRKITNANRKRVRDYFIEYKSNKPCADCGKTFHHAAMDFDHIEDNKEHNVSHMMAGFSIEKIEQEIAKCELVCACCHRVRTWNRKHSRVV